MSRKSGALNYLEPLGPVQACCGRPLLFYIRSDVPEDWNLHIQLICVGLWWSSPYSAECFIYLQNIIFECEMFMLHMWECLYLDLSQKIS